MFQCNCLYVKLICILIVFKRLCIHFNVICMLITVVVVAGVIVVRLGWPGLE